MNLQIESYNIEIFGHDLLQTDMSKQSAEIIWLIAFPGEGAKIWELCSKKCTLAVVTGLDWNADLSPWAAKKVFKQGEDFKGNASHFLDVLINKIIPETQKYIGVRDVTSGIAGYSLAGLFAVYAMYNCDYFNKCASVSGSLWFDDFTEYVLDNKNAPKQCEWYISLGSKEHLTSNKRMAKVKETTELLVEEWKKKYNVVYEINAGGHFTQPLERMARGIDVLSNFYEHFTQY